MRQSAQVQTLQSDQKISSITHMEAIRNQLAHAGGDGAPVVGRAALEALVVAAEASLRVGISGLRQVLLAWHAQHAQAAHLRPPAATKGQRPG